LDIDPLEFYREHYTAIPVLERDIRTLLSHRAGSDSPQRVFSKGGIIISPRRTSLQPTRAEALIVSSVRYTAQFKKIKNPPRIPRLGVIEREPAGPARLARAALAAQDDAAEDQFIPAEEHEVVAEDYFGEEEFVPDNVVAEE
jgi:hAT family C-terminal dimerisation region